MIGSITTDLTWSSNGTPVSVDPPPPPPNLLNGVAGGLAVREYNGWKNTPAKNMVDTVVFKVYWKDLAPTGQTFSGPGIANLRAQLADVASTKGISGSQPKAVIRLQGTFYAPTWVGQDPLVGSVTWWANDATVDASTGATRAGFIDGAPASQPTSTWRRWATPIPMYWKPRFQVLWLDAMNQLYTALADYIASGFIVEVDWGGFASTQYVEPCNQQISLEENRQTLKNNGWTQDVWAALFGPAWDSYMASPWATARVGCMVSYNATGVLVPSTKNPSGWSYQSGGADKAIALMETHIAKCGALTILFNESYENPYLKYLTDKPLYQRMVDAYKQQKIVFGLQTETLVKLTADYKATSGLTNTQDTIKEAVSMGAIRVEIPVGCWLTSQTVSVGCPLNYVSGPADGPGNFAATWSPQLTANGNGLWA